MKNNTLKNYLSRKKIIEKAFNDRKAEFINFFKNMDYSFLYKRVSEYSNTQDYFNAIQWQDFIVSRYLKCCDWQNKIKRSYRKESMTEHAVSKNENEKREDIQCRIIASDEKSILGKNFYYQLPLKAPKKDLPIGIDESYNNGLGKIDLISTLDGKLNLIEYKIPSSSEPLLRAVLEILTYRQNIINNKQDNGEILLINNYNKKFACDVKEIVLSVVVPISAYNKAHPYALELIEENNINTFCFAKNQVESENYKEIERFDICGIKKSIYANYNEFKSTKTDLEIL